MLLGLFPGLFHCCSYYCGCLAPSSCSDKRLAVELYVSIFSSRQASTEFCMCFQLSSFGSSDEYDALPAACLTRHDTRKTHARRRRLASLPFLRLSPPPAPERAAAGQLVLCVCLLVTHTCERGLLRTRRTAWLATAFMAVRSRAEYQRAIRLVANFPASSLLLTRCVSAFSLVCVEQST